MKRKDEGCDGEETVKRLASPASLLPDQYLVQPQQLAAVQLLTSAATGSLIGAPSGVSTVSTLTVPTALAVAVQTEQGSVPGESCLLGGGTVTYTQPAASHSSGCNIVLASPQHFVPTSIAVTDSTTISNSSSVPNSAGVDDNFSTGPVINTNASSSITSYASSSSEDTLCSYSSSRSSGDTNTESVFSVAPVVTGTSYNPPSCTSTNLPAAPLVVSTGLSVTNAYAIKRSQESTIERQQRLSKRFDALIRAKIIELVKARGLKKTVCPSEVARSLSPKAWRDLMPAVRKIGAQLVKEGIILVTQRGTIVDLSTSQGPVRFGLAE